MSADRTGLQGWVYRGLRDNGRLWLSVWGSCRGSHMGGTESECGSAKLIARLLGIGLVPSSYP